MGDRKALRSRRRQRRRPISKARLREMIEDYVDVPFETTVLGVPVTVGSVDLTERDEIVAICVRGRERQAISILDLPLPSPPLAGAEWIEAYRHWAGKG